MAKKKMILLTAKDYFLAGNKKFEEKKYLKAIDLYTIAARRNYTDAKIKLFEIFDQGIYDDMQNCIIRPHYETATVWLREIAEYRNAEDLYRLALCCQEGKNYAFSYEHAFKLLELADKKGHIGATYLLATYYDSGKGVAKDTVKAFELYKKAAESGHVLALRNLGDCYIMGYGAPRNYDLARECYERAEELGDAISGLNIGKCHEHGKGFPKSFINAAVVYEGYAEKANPDAKFFLAVRYENGDGVPQSYEKAAKWYKKTAEWYDDPSSKNSDDYRQTCSNAMYTLAMYYDEGCCIEQNSEEAVKWYKKAAELDHPSACFTLGLYYKYGRGVKANAETSFKFFLKGMTLGHLCSKNMVALCLLTGDGAQMDHKLAVKLFGECASKGLADAVYHLGRCYYNGWGVLPSYHKAVEYFEQAINMGYLAASDELGICYENGNGVPINPEKAVECYLKAAKQDEAEMHFIIGGCYESGIGMTQSYKKAAEAYGGVNQLPSTVRALAACYYFGRRENYNTYAIAPSDAKAFSLYDELVDDSIKKEVDNNANGKTTPPYPDYNERSFIPIKPDQKAKYYKREFRRNGNGRDLLYLGCYYYHGCERTAGGQRSDFNPSSKNPLYKLIKLKNWLIDEANKDRAIPRLIVNIYDRFVNRDDKCYEKALDYFRRAEALGVRDAKKYIGYFLANGFGTDHDREKAIEYYIEWSKPDVAQMYYSIGVMYETAQKSKKDVLKAIKYYTMAEKLGYVKAIYRLAVGYEGSFGPEFKSDENAKKYHSMAAMFNHAPSLYYLALLAESKGNHREAVDYLRKIVKQTNVSAQNDLEICYFNNHNLPLRYPRAVELYQKLTDRGNAEACQRLANCYERGFGVNRSPELAAKWRRIAKSHGYEE